MKKGGLKKLSKSDTKRQVKRYKDEVIVSYALAMKGNKNLRDLSLSDLSGRNSNLRKMLLNLIFVLMH